MNKQKVKDFLKKHWWGLLISIAVPELVGMLSSLISGNSREIYESLNLPPVSPPGWLFPVAWVILYACMGVAAYMILISSASKKEKIAGIVIYIIQLALNFSWSIVFFRFKAFGGAVIVIMALTLVVSFMMAFFYRINRNSGYIILDYVIWLLYAFYLTVGVFLLN